MFVIETAYGRVEAADEKEARQALRKAAKEAKIKAAQEQADSDRAYALARENGYRLLERKLRGVAVAVAVLPNRPCGPKVTVNDEERTTVVCETQTGNLVLETYRNEVLCGLTDAGGFTIGLILRHATGEVNAYAVGFCNGKWAFQDLPHVGAEDCRKDE